MGRRTRGGMLGLGTIAVLTLGLQPVWAGDKVTGEVVDLSCYLHHPATSTGSSHRKCAEMCAKKGLPMGLLTADKQVFLLLEDHDNPKAYAAAIAKAAQQVTVEGDKVDVGGVQGLMVESVTE